MRADHSRLIAKIALTAGCQAFLVDSIVDFGTPIRHVAGDGFAKVHGPSQQSRTGRSTRVFFHRFVRWRLILLSDQVEARPLPLLP